MALAAELSALEIEPPNIYTTATVTLEKRAQSLATTQLRLYVNARIPGIDRLDFERAADSAKKDWLSLLPFQGQLTISVNLSAW